MKKIIYLLPVFILIEIILVFAGPLAFIKKPSLLVIPPYVTGQLTGVDYDSFYNLMEKKAAEANLFSVKSRQLLETYYLNKAERESDLTGLPSGLYLDEYLEIAKELGIERALRVNIFPFADHTKIRFSLFETENDTIIIDSDLTLPPLEEWNDKILEDMIVLADILELESAGLPANAWLYFLFLFSHFILIAVYFGGHKKTFLFTLDIVLLSGVLIFLFAFIFSFNADMDYVQQYLLTTGSSSLGKDSQTEQIVTIFRFVPLLVLDLFIYFFIRFLHGSVRRHRDWSFWMILLSAGLTAFALPSGISDRGFGLFAWFSLVFLFLVIKRRNVIQGAVYTVFWGALNSLFINYWHGTYNFMSLPTTVLLMSLEFVIFAPVLTLLMKRAARYDWLVFSGLFLLFDYIRTLGFLAYPWGFLGTSQSIFLPFIQSADIFGVWGIHFLVLLSNGVIGRFFSPPEYPGWNKLPIVVFTLLFVTNFIYGAIRLRTDFNREGQTINILSAQQSTDPRKADYRETFEILRDLTNEGIDNKGQTPDLVLWSECAFNPDIRFWLNYKNKNHSRVKLVNEMESYQKSLNTWLLTGTQDHEFRGEGDERRKHIFNSTVLYEPSGEKQGYYYKMKLVPFTENFPFREKYREYTSDPEKAESLGFLGRQMVAFINMLDNLDTTEWTAGTDYRVFRHEKFNFLTPVCFEDIFPDHIRRFVYKGADIILNVSNDYWALTPTEGRQHAYLSLFRAVENRRPMLRSTASGMTVYIDVYGRVVDEAPFYEPAWLWAEVPLPEKKLTIYTRYGDWFPKLFFVLIPFLWLTAEFLRWRKRRVLE